MGRRNCAPSFVSGKGYIDMEVRGSDTYMPGQVKWGQLKNTRYAKENFGANLYVYG